VGSGHSYAPLGADAAKNYCMAVGHVLQTVVVTVYRYSKSMGRYGHWTFYYSSGLTYRNCELSYLHNIHAILTHELTLYACSVNSDRVMSSSSRFIVTAPCNILSQSMLWTVVDRCVEMA